MAYKAPKLIKNHPSVQECSSGHAGASDYKHEVVLKNDWKFTQGRMAETGFGFFHTVKAFLQADPQKR